MRKLPPNLFGIPFGLAGLAGAWHYAGVRDLVPTAVGDVLALVGAVAWVTITVAYARALRRPGALVEDLTHPIAGPFLSLALIAPLVLVVTGVVPHAPDLGRVLVDVLAVAIVVLGGWYTGQWIYAPIQPAQLHPGYFLPTVAGGLLAAAGAASVGQQRFAEVLLGYGLICWLILGSIILGRLLVGPSLPTPLLPTLAIEVAPAAVATQAYLAVRGEAIDPLVAVFAGYGLLMVLAQVRLLPVYGRLGFAPSIWAFTFSWAAVVTAGLHWLAILKPAGWRVWAYVLLGAVTLLIGAIAWRTVVAMVRGQLLPAPAPAAAA